MTPSHQDIMHFLPQVDAVDWTAQRISTLPVRKPAEAYHKGFPASLT